MTHTILRIIPLCIIVMMGSEGSSRFGALVAEDGPHVFRALTRAFSTHKGFKQDDNLGECVQQRTLSMATGPASSDGVAQPARSLKTIWHPWELKPSYVADRILVKEIKNGQMIQDDSEQKIRHFELQIATPLSPKALQHTIKRGLHLYQPLKIKKQDGTEHNFVAWFAANTTPVDAEKKLRRELVNAEEKKRFDDKEKAEEDLKKSQIAQSKPLLDAIRKTRQECIEHGITGFPKDSPVYRRGNDYLYMLDIFDELTDHDDVGKFLENFYISVTGRLIDEFYDMFCSELGDVDFEKLSQEERDKYDKATDMIDTIQDKIEKAVDIYRRPYKLPPLATILPSSPVDQAVEQQSSEKDGSDK